jgi:hypothetical protein
MRGKRAEAEAKLRRRRRSRISGRIRGVKDGSRINHGRRQGGESSEHIFILVDGRITIVSGL